jgi:plasmid stability protein
MLATTIMTAMTAMISTGGKPWQPSRFETSMTLYKARLRICAASHARSIEEEARVILREALQGVEEEKGLATLIHERYMSAGGVEQPLPGHGQRERVRGELR